ncbi:RNA helicase aquarius [Eumeta japonica]|uniref:RNA helicase aquarius n=1 Tax=Eumeta variegata TaxID=151549 RepID=A0A4C1SRH3_EUMVA|nr:RNA helicase aquarius [Eumeta japonica]
MKTDPVPVANEKPKIPLPTVSQINADRITLLANQYWSPQTKENHLPFDGMIVESIYQAEIIGSNFSIRRIMMLEFSQYLENYLWPHYEAGRASHAHMMSIVVMLNEKFRERVPAWQAMAHALLEQRFISYEDTKNWVDSWIASKDKEFFRLGIRMLPERWKKAFQKKPDHFPAFFEQVLRACISDDDSGRDMREQTALLLFLNHCFGSMEVQLCRDQVKRLVSLSMWISLQEGLAFDGNIRVGDKGILSKMSGSGLSAVHELFFHMSSSSSEAFSSKSTWASAKSFRL